MIYSYAIDTASPSTARAAFCRQLLNNGKSLLGIGITSNSTDRRNDLVIGGDDESRTFRRAVADLVAAGILHRCDGLSLIGVGDFDIVGFGDFALLIRGDRQLAGAILRIGGEVV